MRIGVRSPALAACLLLLLGGGLPLLPAGAATAGAQAPPQTPAAVAERVRSALYDAQDALIAGDGAGAQAAVAMAMAAAGEFPAAGVDPGAIAEVQAALTAAANAVDGADPTALAIARGRVWTGLVRASYDVTLRATADGRAEEAAAWLLLRDFRPTNRFSRPRTDATLAIRDLAQGATTPAAAELAVRADLLDTYQGRLESVLNAVAAAVPPALAPSQAEAVGLAAGYWAILAPAYEEQQGAAARAEVDAAFAGLSAAVAAGDAAAFREAATRATAAVQSFQAAPLSESEQARRANQLLRYLSLVAIEYGRGVKQGQVTLDIEIQEARAFLDGARGAFADLRLTLTARDGAATEAVAATLAALDADLSAAASRERVAEPSAISAATDDAAKRLQQMFPEEWARAGGDADFDVVSALLDQMEGAVAAKQYQQAESSRLEAYAIFETGPEKRLLAFAPDTARQVERLFWEGDGQTRGLASLLADHAAANTVRATRLELDRALTAGQAVLGSGQTARGTVIFNAATIVFREGLEAILILASLMASMIGVNRRYRRPLAIGAGLALLVTAALFVLARGLLQSLSQYGEKLEAIVSLIAIAVLLLVLNWFFHKVYWTRWISHHHERRRLVIAGVGGQALGLVVLGFSSVFREGAETVLFLQALVLDAGVVVVIEGTLLGLAATAVVGVLTLVLQTKLPHKKMLIVTGVMIAVVLVTMVGSTVHILQLVGWAPITPIGGLIGLPDWLGVWFGVFPTWQGLLAQVAAAVFVVGSYYVAERSGGRVRPRPAAIRERSAKTAPSGEGKVTTSV